MGRRCLGGRNTLKLVLPSKTVLWKYSWNHGKAGERQQELRDICSSSPCSSCIDTLPRIPTKNTFKVRTHTALSITHLMCEAIQYSHLLAFSYCSLKQSAIYDLAFLGLLGMPTMNECWRSAAKLQIALAQHFTSIALEDDCNWLAFSVWIWLLPVLNRISPGDILLCFVMLYKF